MTELVRGDIVLFAERGEYTSKPRPGLVIQHSATLAVAPSITLCGITSLQVPANDMRILVTPDVSNGLRETSWIMVDKIATISRARLRETIGCVDEGIIRVVDQALRRWLDL